MILRIRMEKCSLSLSPLPRTGQQLTIALLNYLSVRTGKQKAKRQEGRFFLLVSVPYSINWALSLVEWKGIEREQNKKSVGYAALLIELALGITKKSQRKEGRQERILNEVPYRY
uniref:Uncharacterized protein n=1 Tax=Utricularia reniformis TaxID=192314 RepID=A0A1Y0B1P2_9LAMI|nr:hypothetical protein AEK19_MT1111 [Utricularia reniformis]ART31330.1 hypothetical protein AEK19_MT1111 [Utricularia reniformis]